AAQLVCCPKSFTRKGPPRLVVNQADQVQLVRHRCELPANGLQSKKESVVVHDRHFAVETDRRTMNLQRTANCVLTVCLSPGGKSILWLLGSGDDLIEGPVLFQGNLIEKAQGGNSDKDRTGRQLSFVGQVDLIGTNILRPQLLRRLVEMASEQGNLLQVGSLRVR